MIDGQPGITQQLDAPLTTGPNKGQSNVSIPAQKLVIFTHRREGDNYEGRSSLRSAYKHWFFKDTLYRLDGIRHERQGV
jgi:predicted transcriptional regulator YdeE